LWFGVGCVAYVVTGYIAVAIWTACGMVGHVGVDYVSVCVTSVGIGVGCVISTVVYDMDGCGFAVAVGVGGSGVVGICIVGVGIAIVCDMCVDSVGVVRSGGYVVVYRRHWLLW